MRVPPVFAVILLTTGLLATGCGGPSKAAAPLTPDWPKVAGRDLNCASDQVEKVADLDDSDINDDGTPDHFVTMRCSSADHAQPGQLEVFAGGSPVADPVRLGVLVRNWQGNQLTGCVAVVHGVVYAPGTDAHGVRSIWASHWVGSGTDRRLTGERTMAWNQVPGCP
jgi:hypothetical protein